MRNRALIIRISIGLLLLLMVLVGGVAAQDETCYATPDAGVPVPMLEKPDPDSERVNTLFPEQFEPADDAFKGEAPSELEPEGAGSFWIHITPEDGSPDGWVHLWEVDLFGGDCDDLFG